LIGKKDDDKAAETVHSEFLSSPEQVELFLSQHKEKIIKVKAGKTLLHLAVAQNLPKLCFALLTLPFSPSSSSSSSPPLLEKLRREFLDAFDDAGYTAIMNACQLPGREKCVESIVKNLVSPQQLAYQSTEQKNKAGFTCVHHAAFTNQVESLRLLIKVGKVDPEVRTNAGFTPLITATYSNNIEAVKVLIQECGANVESFSTKHSTPLFVAVEREHVELIQLLIEQFNANVDHITETAKFNILHHAAYHGRDASLTTLFSSKKVGDKMKSNQLLEAGSGGGSTPLLLAVEQDHVAAADVLLKNGANKSAKNFKGKDAVALARSAGMKKLMV
jgi:ankyrin repeat protein